MKKKKQINKKTPKDNTIDLSDIRPARDRGIFSLLSGVFLASLLPSMLCMKYQNPSIELPYSFMAITFISGVYLSYKGWISQGIAFSRYKIEKHSTLEKEISVLAIRYLKDRGYQILELDRDELLALLEDQYSRILELYLDRKYAAHRLDLQHEFDHLTKESKYVLLTEVRDEVVYKLSENDFVKPLNQW